MQKLHKGGQIGRWPAFPIDPSRWLLDCLHERINYVQKLFNETIYRQCYLSQDKLDRLAETLHSIGINPPRLEKHARNTSAKPPKDVSHMHVPHSRLGCLPLFVPAAKPRLPQKRCMPCALNQGPWR